MDELIVRAREQLADPELTAEKRVHDARKRFKESRAVIRLVRGPLGDLYQRENAFFRDAGRDLAAARDADATLAALKKLELPDRVEKKARRTLKKQAAHPPLEPLIAESVRQLVVAQARVGFWPRLADSFDTIAPALHRAYRDGRRAMVRARSDAEIHEWRKQAKTHWYHVQLLKNVWPPVMEKYAEEMHDISSALGDHHDLHVLRERLPNADPELRDAIEKKQRELELKARLIGARVYVQRAADWSDWMRGYWNAWR